MTVAPATKFSIPSLNGLRAVAITIVIWGHADIPTVIKGSTGVTLFFFLSGYLITTILRREAETRGAVSVRDFYLRRVFRIFPPLYVVLVIAAVLSVTGAIANAMTGWGLTSTAGFFTNYYVIAEGRAGLPAAMNALWSLAVEEHFYLVFPLLYIALRRWLPRRAHQAIVLSALCLLIMLWRVWLVSQDAGYDRVYLSTDTRADAILWGSVLAIIANPALGDVRAPRRAWTATVSVVLSALVFYTVSRSPVGFDMSVGYTIEALVLVGVFVPLILVPESPLGRVLNTKLVAQVGVLSYSLYLVHRPALALAEQLGINHYAEVVIGVAGSFAVAFLLRVTVEKPFEKIRRRLRRD